MRGVVALALACAGVARAEAPRRKAGSHAPVHVARPPVVPTEGPAAEPTRVDILVAMDKVKPHVRECFEKFGVEGLVTATLTVGASGKVLSVTVDEPDERERACIADAVREAQFAPVKREKWTLTYPFVLKPDAAQDPVDAGQGSAANPGGY